MAGPWIARSRNTFAREILSSSPRWSSPSTCLRYSTFVSRGMIRQQNNNFLQFSTYNKLPRSSKSPKLPTAITTPRRQFSYTDSCGARYNRFGQQQQQHQNGGFQFRFGSGYMQDRLERVRRLLSSRVVLVVIGGGTIFYVFNLETVEETGRRRFNFVSPETENMVGEQNYQAFLAQYKDKIIPDNHPYAKFVKRVMDRLIPNVKLEGANWKVHVINDREEQNAFVLPSGKVFVFTGLFPIAQDENGLAAVLGHEIAHVVARHPAERMSSGFIVTAAVLAISSIFDISGQLSSLLMNLLYSFPNSRTQEAEADRIGLMIMSESCFNPQAAIQMWERFDKMDKGSPPQFISTHPSHYNRSQALREWLPEAEGRLDASGCDFTGRYLEGFQNTYNKKADW